MHVLMVTLMVTFGSVDQSHIYKSDLWIVISGRRRFDPGIDQRVPFISDPWAEFKVAPLVTRFLRLGSDDS